MGIVVLDNGNLCSRKKVIVAVTGSRTEDKSLKERQLERRWRH